MEENYRILSAETDQDGKPFTIVRMPTPPISIIKVKPTDPIYAEYRATTFAHGLTFAQVLSERSRGKSRDVEPEVEAVVPASYCNFLISNGVVLVGRYYTEGRAESFKQTDGAARAILQHVFPAHKIIQIECENVNLGGGGMHCISQQQPHLF
jgi:agmatine deiminase